MDSRVGLLTPHDALLVGRLVPLKKRAVALCHVLYLSLYNNMRNGGEARSLTGSIKFGYPLRSVLL